MDLRAWPRALSGQRSVPNSHSLAGGLFLRTVGLGRGAAWGGLTDTSAPAPDRRAMGYSSRGPWRRRPLSVRQRWTRNHRNINIKRSGFAARGRKRLRSAGKVPRREGLTGDSRGGAGGAASAPGLRGASQGREGCGIAGGGGWRPSGSSVRAAHKSSLWFAEESAEGQSLWPPRSPAAPQPCQSRVAGHARWKAGPGSAQSPYKELRLWGL